MRRSDARVAELGAAKDRFLRFLEPRVGSRADAEDLLQTSLVKAIEHVDELRDDERLVSWFYAVLRNQIAEHHRRRAARARATEGLAGTATDPGGDDTLLQAACACVGEIARTLKPEYAAVLQRIEVDEQTPRHLASELGITANALAVRLHRARRALGEQLRVTCGTCATHGCLDCQCGETGRGRSPAL